ncbi:F0F1 ATP synthase subunit A [Mucilaginibacter psychrotolerans]|uniref:ATP synthase subunit a n=1 Tax=Mucilaginibacter psychrotolerans TaxID=1524096 RepID=A0A4Y8SNV9_9SPHI|nr:F0F1 ATP synthase subunit A [Mucilaginibacter psychrotolerans]
MHFSHVLKSKKIALSLILGVFLTFCTCKTFATQAEHAPETEQPAHTEGGHEEAFNPSEVILEHIADSHSIHLWGTASIALPVILYTDKGLEVFSAANFEHGHKDFAGKHYTYRLVKDKVAIVEGTDNLLPAATVLSLNKKLIDFSITRNVVSMWMSMLIIFIIFLSVSSAYKKREGKAPKGLQSFIEPIIMFVRDDIARPNIGYKYERFMPLLLTVFFFIWVNNLIGLVPFFPGGANLTGNIAVTFVLAFITLVVVNINGNKYYWKHIFAPDVPVWLYPIMWPVELVGIISKPFALMIRLFANITAGHIIVLSLISLIFVFKAASVSLVSVPFVVFMDVLELLVAALQAFIFTLLTALFIGTAIEEHHH